MRIYISADIEGVTGVSTWQEADDIGSFEAREKMTQEVAAACRAALEAGATTILVKDAHGHGKNLIPALLPKEVRIISGWSNHPYNMVEGIDDTFAGIIFIGYHSDATSNASPLAHTLTTAISGMWINDEPASEFILHALAANMLGVPVLALAGDGGIVRVAKAYDSAIETVATQEGFGGAVISVHPELACERIYKAVKKAFPKIGTHTLHRPEKVCLKVSFRDHKLAYKYAFYPGVEQIDEHTIRYESTDYFDILRLLLFM